MYVFRLSSYKSCLESYFKLTEILLPKFYMGLTCRTENLGGLDYVLTMF